MHMATELDAGDIIDQVKTPIDPDENVEAVHDRLAQLGGELLVKVVADIAAGTAKRTPQDLSLIHILYLGLPLVQRAVFEGSWKQIQKQTIWRQNQ